MSLTFKQVRDFLQKRYDLDIVTANITAKMFIEDDIKINRIFTMSALIRHCDYLEELGK